MKRALAAVMSVGMAALAVGMSPAFARSDGPLATATCKVAGTVMFSPAITNVSQTAVSNVYDGVTLSGCSGGVASATIKGSLTGATSCKKATVRGTLTFKWNTGDKSKVKLKYKNGILSGTVKSGLFAGGTVSGEVGVSMNGSCTSGVTSGTVNGSITL